MLKTINGVAAKRYLWDGIAMLLEKNPTGAITKRLCGEDEQRVGATDAGNYFYTLSDQKVSGQQSTSRIFARVLWA